jgi:predicted RNA-binding Zn-ribbon protein involved in translation (DUF1610 family)
VLDQPPGSAGAVAGRETELARLAALVHAPGEHGRVLVVLGDAGMGKSTLLANAADQARSAGLQVLWATGRESEASFAFAGLHQLLTPVLDAAAGLPQHQAQALLGALGLAAAPAAADGLVTGLAALTLLSDVSESTPVLAVIDDAQWTDRSSLDVLAFVSTRLDAERVVVLLAADGRVPPPGFDRGVAELRLEPLSAPDAGALLDQQPRPPRGRARSRVIAQAAGNPMALIELARVIAEDPAASRRWAAEPLPPGDRLTAAITARLDALPESARAALLVAAVAAGPDLRAAAGGVLERDAEALAMERAAELSPDPEDQARRLVAAASAAGDPRGVLNLSAGRRHNQRVRDWRVGHLIRALRDKAEAAGITVKLVDERGTSSTCPACSRRAPKPAGRNFRCPHCGHEGHRDLIAAANIAARNGGGTIPAPPESAGITHRRAGTHLPGVHPARRDPRRRPPSRPPARGPLAGTGPPPTATTERGVARHTARSPQAIG